MEFYYVLSEDECTATCYYDDRWEERGGILPKCGLYGYRLFSGFNRLKKVVFDATCKDFCPTYTFQWFASCSQLKDVVGIENLNTSEVSDMNSMFSGCRALTHLDLSSLNTVRVRCMCSMFQGCYSLKSLDLSGFSVRAVENMNSMFSDCTALTQLDLSYFNPKKVTTLHYMFFNCRELTTIYCKTTWSCGKSEAMFEDCRKLRGAVPYDLTRTDVEMANPETGYFSSEEPNLSLSETASEAALEKKEEPANNEEHMTPNEFVNCSFFTVQGVPIEGGVADLPAGMYLMKKD